MSRIVRRSRHSYRSRFVSLTQLYQCDRLERKLHAFINQHFDVMSNRGHHHSFFDPTFQFFTCVNLSKSKQLIATMEVFTRHYQR